jgi:predicted Fe-S protein YdhL (DUF1289 family)
MVENQIETPCTGDCEIDQESGYCRGCWRTVTEIARWTKYSPERRRAVMEEGPPRAQGLIGPADD